MSRVYSIETTYFCDRFGDDNLSVRARVRVEEGRGWTADSDLDCYGYLEVEELSVTLDGRDLTDSLEESELDEITTACEEAGQTAHHEFIAELYAGID